MFRVLFTGDNWYGSNARSCCESLRRLGHNVFDVDQQTFLPEVTMFTSRIIRRLLWFRSVDEFNREVLRVAQTVRPDIAIVFSGWMLQPATLDALKQMGLPLYNYYPDTSAFTHGKLLPLTLPKYDCVFYTKPFWYADVTKHISLKNACFLPHGYCASLHRPFPLMARDLTEYGCDVSFIASHTLYKERILLELVRLRPDLDLAIWGPNWVEHCQGPELQRFIRGYPLYGEAYARAIQASKINLAIMSGQVAGASSGDLTTSRTYAIPAAGGFMLHERNAEVLELYEEGKEIACFVSPEDLASKIDYYLGHPEERQAVARAGYARCVPAYSYDNRMAELLRWDAEHRLGQPSQE